MFPPAQCPLQAYTREWKEPAWALPRGLDVLDLLAFLASEGLPKDSHSEPDEESEVVPGQESSTSSPGEGDEAEGHAPAKREENS